MGSVRLCSLDSMNCVMAQVACHEASFGSAGSEV